jgi:AcrR family transcriptional regulator
MSAEQRREQLLDVTKEVVGERGFHGTSIEAVAQRAGISRPIVYHHFETLGALFEAMLEREGARALSQLGEVIPERIDADDPREALLGALRGYLETVRGDPVTWRLVLMPPEGAPEALRLQITDGRDAVVAVLAGLVGAGIAPGADSPDPQLTARMVSAVADEGARLLLTDPKAYPIDRLVDHARWMLGQISSTPS